MSVLFLPVLYMTAALALLSGMGLGLWVFPTGLLLWGAAVVMLHRKDGWQRVLVTLLLFLAVFALAAWGLSFALDWGYLSRTYHAQAILSLLEGVNPYHYPADWEVYTYPAAHWLISSSFVLWTQSFTASFAFTLVAVFASFLCARRFFVNLPHLSRRWRNLLAFLLACNPIATLGFSTHHNDGLLASTLLSVFLLLLCFVVEDATQSRTTRLRVAVYVAALLVLLVNIKFTGLVYGGILGLTALAYGIRRGASRKTLLQLAGLGSGAAILGVALFGFYPYATNVMQGKSPFHPAIQYDEQGNRTDLFAIRIAVRPVIDKEFYEKSHYEKWWIGLFLQHGKTYWETAPLPPFSSLRPLSFLRGPGSFFSGSLLLCLTLVFFIRHRGGWIVLAGVMASVLSTDVSFYARLIPQNWWLPILFLVFLLAPDDRKPLLSRGQRTVVFVVTACLLYISVLRLGNHGKRAVSTLLALGHVERQEEWFAVPDTSNMGKDTPLFLNYYKSGLSGVRLPILSECPEKAEQHLLAYGLMLCKP